MLVLSRKSDESIKIGDNIEIKIGKIMGNRTQICITAPKDIKIVRGELDKHPTPEPSSKQKCKKEAKVQGEVSVR